MTDQFRHVGDPLHTSDILKNGPFHYLSKNGTGPHALLNTLREHYAKLSIVYRDKGMEFEATLFAQVAEDFENVRQRIRELPASYEPLDEPSATP